MTPKPDRPILWNPRTFDCGHNRQRLLIEKRNQHLEGLSSQLDQKYEKISKILDQFEHFFISFGQNNPENSVTKIVETLRDKNSQEAVIVGEKYFDHQIHIVEYMELLEKIQKDALRLRCWCTKQPIGQNK